MNPFNYPLKSIKELIKRYPDFLEYGFDTYDGDSIRCLRDLGEGRYDVRSCRIMGVDCPELRHKSDLHKQAGKAVSEVVDIWLKAIPREYLQTVSLKLDKYAGRFDGDFFDSREPDNTLSGFLLESGIAKPYDGGKKSEFTEVELEAIIAKCNMLK